MKFYEKLTFKEYDFEKMEEEFDFFLMDILDLIHDLNQALLPLHNQISILDYSIESVDKLETLIFKYLDDELQISLSQTIFFAGITAYIGELICKKTNGYWTLCTNEDLEEFGANIIKYKKGGKDCIFSPFTFIGSYLEYFKPERGTLKKTVEQCIS